MSNQGDEIRKAILEAKKRYDEETAAAIEEF